MPFLPGCNGSRLPNCQAPYGKRRVDPEALTMSRNTLNMLLRRSTLCAVLGLSAMGSLAAQEQPQPADKETLQSLLKRIDQLEARVRQLEAERPSASGDATQLRIAANAPAPLPGMDGPPAANGAMQTPATRQGNATSEPVPPAAALQNAVAQVAS